MRRKYDTHRNRSQIITAPEIKNVRLNLNTLIRSGGNLLGAAAGGLSLPAQLLQQRSQQSAANAAVENGQLSKQGSELALKSRTPNILKRARYNNGENQQQENVAQNIPTSVPSSDVKLPESPVMTPIKPLPFSPSQFLNSPCLGTFEDRNLRASTPVRKTQNKHGTDKKELETFSIETPHKSLVGPRTPTPFKNALAALGKKRRFVPPIPSSLVKDLAEIIHDEQQNETNNSTATIASGNEVKKEKSSLEERKDKAARTNVTPVQQTKKARKSLITSWGENVMPTADVKSEKKVVPFETETPSKFLASSDAIVLLPSNIMKDTLCSDADQFLNDENHAESKKENRAEENTNKARNNQKYLDPKWEKLVCGQTKDQQYMVQQAHACLKNLSLLPRSQGVFIQGGGNNTTTQTLFL